MTNAGTLDAGAAAALDRLSAARASRRPCAPVRDLLPADDLDAAYAVQSAWVAGQLAAGARVIGRNDLDGDVIGRAEVAAATAYVVAALEIVDSRIADWDISIVDSIADNASSGLFVLGDRKQGLGVLDLADCAMTMRRRHQVVSTGTGSAVLGHPLASVAWLAATVRDLGRPLRAGEVILSGSLGPMVPVAPDRFSRA